MADEHNLPQRYVRLMISGRVQGVSYRVWLQAEARARGISGWARNRLNGDVECVLAGPAEAVQTLIEVCRSGPPAARVDQILVEDCDASALDPSGGQAGFVILPTV